MVTINRTIFEPYAVILSKMDAILFKRWVGIAWQHVRAAVRVTKGSGERSANLGVIPLIPEGGLSVHWRHQVDLK
jgi:hypothetical protein